MPLLLAVIIGGLSFFLFSAFALRSRTAQKEFLVKQLHKYTAPRLQAEVEPGRNSTWREFLETVAASVVTAKQRVRLQQQLQKAGRHDLADIEDLAVQKVQFGAAGLVVGLLLSFSGQVTGLLLLPVFTVALFYLPDVLVYNAALKRTEALSYQLADALDLLTMCVESGLSFEGALARVCDSDFGAISEEFAALLGELQTGTSRADAFKHLGERNSQEDLLKFAAAMSQVERLGVPVARALREQSTEMRSTRRERAREQAQKVPIKILAPVMICFLPGIFIIILGPAILSIISGLSSF